MKKSVMGQPYEFKLPHEMRDAIDVTLAPGVPEAKRKYLMNIGVGKAGLPEPVGDKVERGFMAAGLIYKQPNKRVLADLTPGINAIRHAQVIRKNHQYK